LEQEVKHERINTAIFSMFMTFQRPTSSLTAALLDGYPTTLHGGAQVDDLEPTGTTSLPILACLWHKTVRSEDTYLTD